MQPNSDEGGRVKFCDINSFKLVRWWAVSQDAAFVCSDFVPGHVTLKGCTAKTTG